MPSASKDAFYSSHTGSVAKPLAASVFLALAVLVGLLTLVELAPVKDALGLTENLLDRFARNAIVRTQWLMFLIGVIYLLIRAGYARRTRKEIFGLLESEQEALLKGATPEQKQAAEKRIEALVARAEATQSASLAPLSFVVWVLPILGFLGTVIGVSNSMGPLEALATGESAAKVAPELLRHLRYPFDATFTGLVLLLPMMACYTVLATRARRWVVDLRTGALGVRAAPDTAKAG